MNIHVIIRLKQLLPGGRATNTLECHNVPQRLTIFILIFYIVQVAGIRIHVHAVLTVLIVFEGKSVRKPGPYI